MHLALAFGLLPLVSAGARGHGANQVKSFSDFADPSTACTLLKQKFSNLTYLPDEEGYEKESEG